MTGRYQVEEVAVAGLVAHPLSDEIFGQLPADRLKDLTDDIAEHGLNNPLELDGHGRVIKGSQRLRAVKALEWKTVPVVRRLDLVDELEIEESLVKDNTLRRHLTPMQMARAGIKLEQIYSARAEACKLANLKGVQSLPNREAQKGASPLSGSPEDRKTTVRVAQDLGISRRRYEDARTIFERGSADVQDKVDRGEVSVAKAASQVRSAKPRIAARQASEVQSAALRFARWQKEINDWTKQTKKATRWLQENPTDQLGPYAPRAAAPCAELREALQAALQEIAGEGP